MLSSIKKARNHPKLRQKMFLKHCMINPPIKMNTAPKSTIHITSQQFNSCAKGSKKGFGIPTKEFIPFPPERKNQIIPALNNFYVTLNCLSRGRIAGQEPLVP
jgi:hypothetical protein